MFICNNIVTGFNHMHASCFELRVLTGATCTCLYAYMQDSVLNSRVVDKGKQKINCQLISVSRLHGCLAVIEMQKESL